MEAHIRQVGKATCWRCLRKALLVRTASTISYAMTAAGIGLTGLAVVFDLGAVATLSGMLLFVAGVVKIGMVAIWKSFFAIPVTETGRPTDESGTTRAAGELHEV